MPAAPNYRRSAAEQIPNTPKSDTLVAQKINISCQPLAGDGITTAGEDSLCATEMSFLFFLDLLPL